MLKKGFRSLGRLFEMEKIEPKTFYNLQGLCLTKPTHSISQEYCRSIEISGSIKNPFNQSKSHSSF